MAQFGQKRNGEVALDICIYNVYTTQYMKQSAVINVRVEPKIKRQAHKVAAELGFSLGSLINGYLHNLVKTKEVYFPPEEPTPYLKRLIKQAQRDRKEGNYVSFKNGPDAVAYLESLIKD